MNDKWRTVVVVGLRLVGDGVLRIDLRQTNGEAMGAWEPGAHVDVKSESGLIRQYSLCPNPYGAAEYSIAVRRVPDGRVSEELHTIRLLGEKLSIGRVRNTFPLVDASAYHFVAGGIGITPLLSMIEEAEKRCKPWHLTYLGKSRAGMPFAQELSERFPDRITMHESSSRGRLNVKDVLVNLAADQAVYCCGPTELIRHVQEACETAPTPIACYVEHFDAQPALESVNSEAQSETFTVRIDGSDTAVVVPRDQSALQALLDAGVDVDYSCEEGYCGTCELALIAGVADHRDTVQTAKEMEAGKHFFPCVSRALTSELTLSID